MLPDYVSKRMNLNATRPCVSKDEPKCPPPAIPSSRAHPLHPPLPYNFPSLSPPLHTMRVYHCLYLELWGWITLGVSSYTLSHPEKDRDWARPRIHAARRILYYASILVFLFERVRQHTSCARDDKHLFVWNTRWRHGRSRGETKYSLKHILFIAMFYLTSLW